MLFVTDDFKEEIQGLVRRIFSSLDSEGYELISGYLIELIDVIGIKYNFKLDDDKAKTPYFQQFRQREYMDARSLMNQLLPFIDDADDSKKNSLKTLGDMYLSRKRVFCRI